MKITKHQRMARFFESMTALGFSYEETSALRRIQMTLHRWSELECGDGNDYASWSLERDEETGKPFLVTYPHTGKSYRRRIADREAGALRRLQTIMAKHPNLWFYHQSDPRGCALYVGANVDIWENDGRTLLPLDVYYTKGIAVSE